VTLFVQSIVQSIDAVSRGVMPVAATQMGGIGISPKSPLVKVDADGMTIFVGTDPDLLRDLARDLAAVADRMEASA
jgi:hypothetical protein